MGEVSDVSSRSAFLTCRHNAYVQPLGDLISPACPVLYGAADITPSQTIQASVRRWLSEYHPSEGPGAEEVVEVRKVGDLDAYLGDVEGEDNWDFSDLTCELDLSHPASTRVDYD